MTKTHRHIQCIWGKAEALGKDDLETVWFWTIREILRNCVL